MFEIDEKHLVRCDHIENRKLALHPFAGNGRVRGKQRRQLDKQGGFRFAAQFAQRIETADIRMLLERWQARPFYYLGLCLTAFPRGAAGLSEAMPATGAVACLRKAAIDIALPAAASRAARDRSCRLRM